VAAWVGVESNSLASDANYSTETCIFTFSPSHGTVVNERPVA